MTKTHCCNSYTPSTDQLWIATGGRFYSNDRIRQHIDRIGQRYYILLKNYWKTGPRENITILTKISQDFPPVAQFTIDFFVSAACLKF